MSPHLDTRVIRIVRWLLDQDDPRSTADLAADLGLSQRVIRYRLGAVESLLASSDLVLMRRRGAGLWIEGDRSNRQELRDELTASTNAQRVYARAERSHVLLASLLWTAPEATSLGRLQDVLEVSQTSARRDLRRCESWLEGRDLPLARRPGVGISVVGTEVALRQALVQLIIEAVPADVLEELCDRGFADARLVRVRVPAGMRDLLAELPIQTCSRLLSTRPFSGALTEGDSDLVMALYLATTAARLQVGKTISMDTGQQRSLIDHPAAGSARELAEAFERAFGLNLSDQEVAGITEYLLGLAAVSSSDPQSASAHQDLLQSVLDHAAAQLHEALKADHELASNLDRHLHRLSVRLRYGLPVHNPLLKEVAERYPDVHAIALDLGVMMEEHFGAPISQDEVGFVTMYLCGAMERSRLRPTRRAIVICPSGMATAWVLVSRLQAEFPQLELVKVLSARSYSADELPDADIVISTVNVPAGNLPVVVVSPLLTSADIAGVARYA